MKHKTDRHSAAGPTGKTGATGVWISLGLSLALIAAGIGFIYARHAEIFSGGQGWSGHGSHGAGMGFMGMGAAGGMGIVLALFWVLLILAALAVISGLFGSQRTACQRPDALEILKQRYARGEIDQDEYEDRRKRLLES